MREFILDRPASAPPSHPVLFSVLSTDGAVFMVSLTEEELHVLRMLFTAGTAGMI